MSTTITLYTDDYGQTIKVNTYLSDIGTATGISLKMKRTSDATTATLSMSEVTGDENYAVSASIASGFLANKAGTWQCQVVATWANAEITGKVFVVDVIERSAV